MERENEPPRERNLASQPCKQPKACARALNLGAMRRPASPSAASLRFLKRETGSLMTAHTSSPLPCTHRAAELSNLSWHPLEALVCRAQHQQYCSSGEYCLPARPSRSKDARVVRKSYCPLSCPSVFHMFPLTRKK